MSRQGIADYVITMRKPGENIEPITHTPESYPVNYWQKNSKSNLDRYKSKGNTFTKNKCKRRKR